MNDFKNYITVADLQGYLDSFQSDTKIFFFDRKNDGSIFTAPKTTLDFYENIDYELIKEDGEREKISGDVLAFIFDRE